MVLLSGISCEPQIWKRAAKAVCWVLLPMLVGGAACSEDQAAEPGACLDGGGPVASSEPDAHCLDARGADTYQVIGSCVMGAGAAATGQQDHEHEEQEFGVFYGREANDDACKYRVSFTNSCITLNQSVTFTVALTRKSDGRATPGAQPSSPEIYMEADGHISPSNEITADERSPGVYAIGPIVFDRSGRWVIRFHFFERCSDLIEDSPHGHTAFYIDVP